MANEKKEAIQILKNVSSVKERAEKYNQFIGRNLERSIIEKLEREIEALEDKVESRKDFSLNTDINAGVSAISKEEALKRFNEIIDIEFLIEKKKLELGVKVDIFNKYF